MNTENANQVLIPWEAMATKRDEIVRVVVYVITRPVNVVVLVDSGGKNVVSLYSILS